MCALLVALRLCSASDNRNNAASDGESEAAEQSGEGYVWNTIAGAHGMGGTSPSSELPSSTDGDVSVDFEQGNAPGFDQAQDNAPDGPAEAQTEPLGRIRWFNTEISEEHNELVTRLRRIPVP